MNAGSTIGVNEILALEVQVRHNLVSDLAETIDANITVGDITFEALTSGGFRSDRWNASVTPGQTNGLTLGESFPASLGIQSRTGQLPLAGTVKIPVTTTPTLGTHCLSGLCSCHRAESFDRCTEGRRW